MISSIVSRLVILLFGTLYPAYASYKAVRTKDVREYVKWMMYWIVFALFTCAETFTDVILGFWFPFYYELKIIVVLWLLSPATKGSSILYRKFVHPTLTKREKEIDEAIMHAKAQGYSTILRLGARGVDYAKYVIMQTAIKGLQNTSKLQSIVLEAPERTAVDRGPNRHISVVVPQPLNNYVQSLNEEPFEAFQYSDDDDADYMPPVVMKKEFHELENEVFEEEEEEVQSRPKRRSARNRKQKKPVVFSPFDESDE